MNIGITYDLREFYLAAGYGEEETAEFDRVETIDEIENALQKLGHTTDRIGNARQLIERLCAGERWDLVFNICEGLTGQGREAQVPAILDVYEIPYTFADPCVMAVCLDKSVTKAVVRSAGLATPNYVAISGLEQVAEVLNLGQLKFPLFAKPIAEGTGKGVTPASRVLEPDDLRGVCDSLLKRFHQPVLLEEYLPGREFTVGLLGTGDAATVLGTLEIILLPAAEPEVYSYINKERCEELVEYRSVDPQSDPIVATAEELALTAWKALSCRDAGRIDLRCDGDGQPQFIEANPLAGLHPQHSDLPMIATAKGLPYVELLSRILESAAIRVKRAAVAN